MSTNYLFYHKSLIFCQLNDYSQIFDFFCSKIEKSGLPITFDTSTIREYISMHIPQKSQKPISSLIELKEKIKGYLFLTVQKSNIKKKRLAMVEIKGQKYYIIGGIYIFPYTASLIKNNRQKN